MKFGDHIFFSDLLFFLFQTLCLSQYYFLTCLTLIFLGLSVTREEPLHERIVKGVNQICISVSALRKAYKNDNEEDKGGKNSLFFSLTNSYNFLFLSFWYFVSFQSL